MLAHACVYVYMHLCVYMIKREREGGEGERERERDRQRVREKERAAEFCQYNVHTLVSILHYSLVISARRLQFD